MDSIDNDIAIIGNIAVVPSILEVVCQATGMGFAAVARVTDDRWVACRVKDELNFGLVPGGELKLESTIAMKFAKPARRWSSTMPTMTRSSPSITHRRSMA